MEQWYEQLLRNFNKWKIIIYIHTHYIDDNIEWTPMITKAVRVQLVTVMSYSALTLSAFENHFCYYQSKQTTTETSQRKSWASLCVNIVEVWMKSREWLNSESDEIINSLWRSYFTRKTGNAKIMDRRSLSLLKMILQRKWTVFVSDRVC